MKKAFNYSVRTREILSLKFLLEEAGNKDEGLEVLILTLFPWQAQQMFRLARPSPILPTTVWAIHKHERGKRSLQEEWYHRGYTTPVKQLGLGQERTIKTIKVYHISSPNSIRWWERLLIQTQVHCIRAWCKRQQDRDLCSILSPTRAVEYLLMVHETETDARRVFCMFLLQDITAFLTSSWSLILLWQERQDCVTTSKHLMGHIWGMAAWVRQEQNTQTAAPHPNDPLYCTTLSLSQMEVDLTPSGLWPVLI